MLCAGVLTVFAASVSGCSGLSSINPFSKEEEKLPGQRIAVITDQEITPDLNAASKPLILPPPNNNASWSQPGGVPSNSLGHLALGQSVRQVWTADAGTGSSSRGRLSAVPLVVGGKVFTLDAAGTVSAFSAGSGARLWSESVRAKNEKRSEGFGGGLALDSGRLYVTTGYGTVVALNPDNGAVIWTKIIGTPIRSSPTAVRGKVYFVSTDSRLHCLDGADGNELWSARGLPQQATLLSNVSPAVGRSVVVAPYPAGDITAYDISSGKGAWTDSLSRTTDTTAAGILADPARPVIDRGVVFAVSHGGKMIASTESSGERVWTRNLASTQMPWVVGDTVYAVNVSGKLMALTRNDGKVRWVIDLPRSSRWNGPVVAGGKVWVISADGLLVGVDAKIGQVITEVDLDTDIYITPVVAAGRMYILTDRAKLIAFN